MTTTRIKPHLVTAEELYQMKTRLDGQWYEVEHGQLMLREPGGEEHSHVGVQLLAHLWFHVHQHSLGRVLGSDCGYILAHNPDTVLAPDVSFRRMDHLTYRTLTPKFVEGAPDLAVEVMSPADRFPKVEQKVQEYLRAGTQLVWVIRPRDHTAVIYRRDGSSQKLGTNDVLDGEEVVPGFTFRLDDLFGG